MKKILTIFSFFTATATSSCLSSGFYIANFEHQQIITKVIERFENKTVIIEVSEGKENLVKQAVKEHIYSTMKLDDSKLIIDSFSFLKNGISIEDNFLNNERYEVILKIKKQKGKKEVGEVNFNIKIAFISEQQQQVENITSSFAKLSINPNKANLIPTPLQILKPDKQKAVENKAFDRLKFNFDPTSIVKKDISYVVIDFETANYEKTSACQIAIALVKNGKIIEKYDTLIKPHPLEFVPGFVKIHFIDHNSVKEADTFDVVWNYIKHFFEDKLVFAHNAAFDMSVLKAVLKHYNLECPCFTYGCTYQLLKKTYKYDNYKLNNLASWNEITFLHHNASEDVKATVELINLHFYNGYALDDLAKLANYSFKKFDNTTLELESPVKKLTIKCPSCGNELVTRNGKYGEFIGCSSFPKCRHVQSTSPTFGTCLKCKTGQIVLKTNKQNHQKFKACTNYPECTYTASYMEEEKAQSSKFSVN